MPQNRRKVAFSCKKKKNQLMQKRQLKETQTCLQSECSDLEENSSNILENRVIKYVNKRVNYYNLCFYQESKEELERLKLDGLKPFKILDNKDKEIDEHFFDGYDFPIRPKWDYTMNKGTLEYNEKKYFSEYIEKVHQKQKNEDCDLSLFELNLETWRQLWRVLELSDIMLIIVDIRYPTLMFPPALYHYIVNVLKKHSILILNKVDLAPIDVVGAWIHYFETTYTGLPVICFASKPTQQMNDGKRKNPKHLKRNYKFSIESVYNIFKECQNIIQNRIDLSTWEQKIIEDMSYNPTDETEGEFDDEPETITTTSSSNSDDYRKDILTLGCVGFPNVGKSSLINALKGRKVVSVSRTPGHTKHFQTIFLTHTVRLCDCPGLVFPSRVPKYLQVLVGSFPIPQLRVPYPSIRRMAEHLADIPKLLKIQLPDDFDEWSPIALAEAWAIKRRYTVAKTSRADVYRAANHLLRCCISGQLNLTIQFYPPKFHENREQWLKHPHMEKLKCIQVFINNSDNSSEDTSNFEDAESDNTDNNNSDYESNQSTHSSHNPFTLLDN